MDAISCYRCGREVAPERVDLERWVAIHAWEDGAALFVCPRCQTDRELETARDLAEGGDHEGA